MFDGFGKYVLWLFAIVGGVIVVRKYGPSAVRSLKSKTMPLALSRRGMMLVTCDAWGDPGIKPLQHGVQSSPTYRWCYIVQAGDSAGSIVERITGDTSRYQELLVANPSVPKKGTMGFVTGPSPWDFADGALDSGVKINIPQTMNAWIDPYGEARGGYLPWPPDSRSIVESEPVESAPVKITRPLSVLSPASTSSAPSSASASGPLTSAYDGSSAMQSTFTGAEPSGDGFDYEGLEAS